jgi:hypothetical protein
MAELVTIPISFFELVVDYERPDLKLLGDRAQLLQAVFEALQPWDPSVDDIDSITTGKFSLQGVNFKIPLKRVSLFFGAGSCKFTRDAVDWHSADETMRIFDTSLSAFTRFTGIAMGRKRTVVALHIQPRTVRFMDILNPFLASQLAALEREPVQTMATVAKWGTRRITLDGSGALANALFLKFEREFKSENTNQEIAQQLKHDGEELFRLLGVEEDRG